MRSNIWTTIRSRSLSTRDIGLGIIVAFAYFSLFVFLFVVFVSKQKVWNRHKGIDEVLELSRTHHARHGLSALGAFRKEDRWVPLVGMVVVVFRVLLMRLKAAFATKGMTAWNKGMRANQNVQTNGAINVLRDFRRKFLLISRFVSKTGGHFPTRCLALGLALPMID